MSGGEVVEGRAAMSGADGRAAEIGPAGSLRMLGGDWCGSGDAGLGAAYPGARAGMTGGEIVVAGDAGEEAGAGMRRGLVVIGGRTGAAPGCGCWRAR